MPNTKKPIGITIGDPSGIGPEIVAKAVNQLAPEVQARMCIFGDESALVQACQVAGLNPTPVVSRRVPGHVAQPKDIRPGHPTSVSGRAQIAYLEEAVAAAKADKIGALVTAPIHKASAQDAGFSHPGHTEFLAHHFDAPNVAMMFAGPKLKVVLATVHEAIAELPKLLTIERVYTAITLLARAMNESFGVAQPRIGVLGLNPHAGEDGRFGSEEQTVIWPAICTAREALGNRAQIEGPLVPDAAFARPFDAFVAMYHDQGLIPVKLIDFDRSVNTTLGLPIPRTSPCHGVAHDIAGTGRANATSMLAAIELAIRLQENRRHTSADNAPKCGKVTDNSC